MFLGKTGILNHVKHTSNDLSDLQQWAGSHYTGTAHYVGQQAVRDHNIITANGTAAIEFAQEVLIALDIAPEEKIKEWCDFYKMGPYRAPMPSLP